MNILKKTSKFSYQHVKIIWEDIQQTNEAWIDQEDILKKDVAICSDTGFIYKKTKDKLWLFTSYSYDTENNLSVGGLTVFPVNTIKKIEKIK